MLTKTNIALAAVLMLGSAVTLAQAANENDGGNETGGFRQLGAGGVVTDGVNPAYHRSLRGAASDAYAFVPGYAAHKQTTTK